MNDPAPGCDAAQARGAPAGAAGLVVRSALFWLGLVLSTVAYAPLTLLTYPLPFAQRSRFVALWSHFNIWWLGVTCRLFYRVQGREHLPGTNAVVLSKHQSAWETLALQFLFPAQTWVLKRELLWIPFFGWGLAMLEPIAIDRKATRKALRQVLEQGTERLRAGRWVIVFPEGTRVAPGETRRFSQSGAALAVASGYPVIPVAHNAGEYWPRRGFVKRPGTITLAVGPAIFPQGRSAAQVTALAEQWIENTMREISGPVAREREV